MGRHRKAEPKKKPLHKRIAAVIREFGRWLVGR
jgi:hypothetical protein